ncbi:molecular chaperone [Kluyvera intermedia]|uniref:fimbrial biogenesis chaperone n=1 Tax=Kluyvera intermedia TaxID=61648 RepID=UPI001F2675E7|nr:molecular chaperone [Kluyvera intermedia]EKU4735725.1 molecular chaperone [Kluyvera ascorbata]MCE9891193.1 molecular chaperone [Kluyvera intermedia]
MNFLSKTLFAGMTVFAVFNVANAGVVVGGTRVIYDGNKKESSVAVTNPDPTPYLIQSWIDTQHKDNDAGNIPFIITPPLYRLEGGQKNVERIVLTGALPENKESLYWLNIKAIPSAKRTDNSLQIAIKTRIKLIYRPAALKDVSLDTEAEKLTWRKSGDQIQVSNPGNYVLSFSEILVNDIRVDSATYVLPNSTASFPLPSHSSGGSVTFKIINDYGGVGDTHRTNI